MAHIDPPDACPICGAEEDRRDTRDDGQAERVWYLCGACWAVWRSAAPKAEWISDCGYAMEAAVRCGATLHPTAREQATAALVAADMEQFAAYADLLAGAPTADKAARRRKADAEQRAAARAYLATVTP